MQTIELANLADLFEGVADIFIKTKDELCELDAKMGDGDLGLTLSKGYGALPDLIREIARNEQSIAGTLMKSGLKMASLVPSTMGTLMAGGLIEGGKALRNSESIGPTELAVFLNGFVAGIQKRGKANPGDRTIVDALLPAAKKAEEAARSDQATLQTVIMAAEVGASEGVENTKNMIPKFGKAAVFSARAIGQVDQGAVAGLYLIRGLKKAIDND